MVIFFSLILANLKMNKTTLADLVAYTSKQNDIELCPTHRWQQDYSYFDGHNQKPYLTHRHGG